MPRKKHVAVCRRVRTCADSCQAWYVRPMMRNVAKGAVPLAGILPNCRVWMARRRGREMREVPWLRSMKF